MYFVHYDHPRNVYIVYKRVDVEGACPMKVSEFTPEAFSQVLESIMKLAGLEQ